MSDQPPSDQERLAGYVEVWWRSVHDLADLLDELSEEEWAAPTDLAGWDVKAVASHVAHLESILAGGEEETADVGEPPHVTGVMGLYTEIGVVTRRETPPREIVAEIRRAATLRHDALLADPPLDGRAQPPRVFAGVPWSWETLLRNRPLDIWMHEQDVRRAVGRPGNLDTPGARHTADYLAESLGFVLVKRVGAPVGTTAVLEVAGSPPFPFEVVEVGGKVRGERLDTPPPDPTVRLRMDRESFVLLAGGRRRPVEGAVTVEGDQGLGARIVEQMATTP